MLSVCDMWSSPVRATRPLCFPALAQPVLPLLGGQGMRLGPVSTQSAHLGGDTERLNAVIDAAQSGREYFCADSHIKGRHQRCTLLGPVNFYLPLQGLNLCIAILQRGLQRPYLPHSVLVHALQISLAGSHVAAQGVHCSARWSSKVSSGLHKYFLYSFRRALM